MYRGFRAALVAGLCAALVLGGAPVSAQDAPAPAAPAAPVTSTPVPDPPAVGPSAPSVRAQRPARRRTAAAAAPAVPTVTAALPVALSPGRPGARLAPGTPIAPAELEAFVDGVVREAMADNHIAGVTVSVVQYGQVVLKKGYGYAQAAPVRPVDPDRTLFRLGSISKTFTWIALMKQVERGRMGLGNPVNQYLPQRLQVRDEGFARPISVQDLMTHSAGFEDRILGQLFEQDANRIRALDVYLRQERPRRVREAGALPVYSNYGVGLAGIAVAEVADQPFARLIELDILRPAGMARTTFREPYPVAEGLPEPMTPAMARDVSQGFRWAGGELEPRRFEYLTQIAPAGAASSTAADMARYMNLILGDGTLDGVTIYSPRTAQAFRTVTTRGAPRAPGWAAGFRELPLPGNFVGYGHDGATLSFRSNMVTVPALGLGVFVAANTETAQRLTTRLPQLIVERFYGGTKVLPAPSTALAEQGGVYAGAYLADRRAFSGLEKFIGVITGAASIEIGRGGLLITRTGGGARSWTPVAGGLFQATDGPEVSAFSVADGRATRWFSPAGGESYARAGLLSQVPTLAILAVLAMIASIATLIGLATRDRRDFRQTSIQSRASAAQTASSALWLLSGAGFALWASSVWGDVARAVYDWPGPWLLIASACALVASLLTVITVILLPAIWKGGRRLDSWTVPRKLRFTATTIAFAAFAIVLAVNGALEPWSG